MNVEVLQHVPIIGIHRMLINDVVQQIIVIDRRHFISILSFLSFVSYFNEINNNQKCRS